MRDRTQWRTTIPARTETILRWSRRLLILAGCVALGYVGYSLLDAGRFQEAQSRQFQQELNRGEPVSGEDGPVASLPSPPTQGSADRPTADPSSTVGPADSSLARIEINSIGLTAMVQEGTDARTLRRGVGHIPGTALPGQQGNVALTAHRDTFFRPLSRIRTGDEITLTTLSGSYLYRVDGTSVVEPEDMEVLADSDDARLTLVTCYPFYLVGPAPKRFIVRAHLISR